MIRSTARLWLGDLPASARANLVRLTAAYGQNHVNWQVVVTEQADEDEIEEYRCIFTEVLADFSTATGDENIIRVADVADAVAIEPLPIVIYPETEEGRDV